MAQEDQNVPNGTGAGVRAALNAELGALFTLSSGATSPSTTIAFQFWADTTSGDLKIRNAANSAWVTIGPMATAGFGLGAVVSVFGRTGAVVAVAADRDGLAQDMQDAALTRPKITDYSVENAAPAISAGTLTLDYTTGPDFAVTLDANITTISPTNWPATGVLGKMTVSLIQDATGSRTVAWPAGWLSPGGTDPVMPSAANADLEIVIWTRDGGTTVKFAEVGQAFA